MIRGGLIYPQLQRLGKISIGEKGEVRTSAKGKEFQSPKKLDFFTIRTHYRTEKGQLAIDEQVMSRLGKQPRELNIRLPFNDLEKNFLCELRYYKGGMIYCSGDGEQAARREERVVDGKTVYGDAKPFGPGGRGCPDFRDRTCKRFGALRVILEEQQQVGGVYEYRTTSRHSIENILSGLMTIQLHTGGILAWLPLTMRLVPQTVMTPDNKTARAYIVQITFRGSPQQLLETVREILSLRAPILSDIKALEAGMPEIADDAMEAKETQDEFYPEQSVVMLHEDDAPKGSSVTNQLPTRDEVIRAIFVTLENHLPYTGPREGAYVKFIPAQAMDLIKEIFRVQKAGELKQLALELLQQGYEDLLERIVPAETEEELDIIDAEMIEDETDGERGHQDHAAAEVLEHALDKDDVPLTSGTNAPQTPQVDRSPDDKGVGSPDDHQSLTEVSDMIHDDDDDDLADVPTPPERPRMLGLVVDPYHVTMLIRWARLHGQQSRVNGMIIGEPVEDGIPVLSQQAYTAIWLAVEKAIPAQMSDSTKSPGRDSLASDAEIERVRIYADTYSLGHVFMQAMSGYHDGIPQDRLDEVEHALQARMAQQGKAAKG